jgi:hypothetical protein
MTRTPRLSRSALAATLAVGLLATACTGSDKKSTPSKTPPPPSTSASSSTASSTPAAAPKPKPPAINPLTGLRGLPKYPTVSVKIDDTEAGRPQVGIDQADIVYIEEVEGGLTRLAAIFSSRHPSRVGYVRSTRPSDPDLLLQYGKITAAYSGGAHDSLPRMHRSGLKSWSNDAGAGYYSRQSHPGDHGYINLVLNVKKVAKHSKTRLTKDTGLRWSTKLPAAGRPARVVRTVVGGTPVEFHWYPRLKKYVRFINGQPQKAADGRFVATRNVVVQKCRIVPHPQDSDVLGNPSMFTYTVGRGSVAVFRNGHRLDGTWSRAKLSSGTTLKLNSGKSLTLDPGGAWFVLSQKSAPTTSSR